MIGRSSQQSKHPKKKPLLNSRLTGDAHMYKAMTFCKIVKKESIIQEHVEEVLPEGLDESVLIQTSQFPQSQKAEHQVPHIHIKN